MLLIDATYVHAGGTKVLLLYLMHELQKIKQDVFYLLDKRLNTQELPNGIQYHTVSHIKYYERHRFLKSNRNKFNKVLCFNNISPSIKMKGETITYLHSLFYLQPKMSYLRLESFVFFMKKQIFILTKKYTNLWVVQTNYIRNELARVHAINKKNIEIIPFFEPHRLALNVQKIENAFLYVSNADTHKNHKKLINAFCKFYDAHKTGKLILTVSRQYAEVHQLINKKIKEGYPIENIGFVAKQKLQYYYAQSAYYIHPSTMESFGLGLIEATEQGCRVLAADKPYSYEVCTPSATFDPESEAAIFKVFERAVFEALPPSTLMVQNQIKGLLNLLRD